MSDYDWVTRPRNYASEAKESYLDVEDATDDHPLVEEGAAEDGGDDVRLSHLHILKFSVKEKTVQRGFMEAP